MKICFRVDGGCYIGLGHIMRCIALARELESENSILFVSRESIDEPEKYISGIEMVKKYGFDIVSINENRLIEGLKDIEADCIITDSYEVSEEYFKEVKKIFKKSGCLDDEKILQYYDVDFIINQNPYAINLKYKANLNTEYLFGTKFAILRDEFRNNQIKTISTEIKKVMVTVGGSDNNNVTEEIIKKINQNDFEMFVVVGPGFKYFENLKKYENDKVHLCLNSNMKDLMEKCDICISSCGSTLYELAAVGVPTIGLSLIENQDLAKATLDKMKLILGSEIKNIDENIKLMDFQTRVNMSKLSQKLIDGKGVLRIKEKINGILAKD